MKPSINDLEPGAMLFDMHYANSNPWDLAGALNIFEPHRVLFKTVITCSGGGEIIKRSLREHHCVDRYTYCNKWLVLLDRKRHPFSMKHHIKAAYAYDDRLFGLLTIEVDVQ